MHQEFAKLKEEYSNKLRDIFKQEGKSPAEYREQAQNLFEDFAVQVMDVKMDKMKKLEQAHKFIEDIKTETMLKEL